VESIEERNDINEYIKGLRRGGVTLDYDRRITGERTEWANEETVRAKKEITCEREETEGFSISQTTYRIYTVHGQPRYIVQRTLSRNSQNAVLSVRPSSLGCCCRKAFSRRRDKLQGLTACGRMDLILMLSSRSLSLEWRTDTCRK
jgi:hypothetical protein